MQIFWAIFSSFIDKYGKVTPTDIDDNVARMKKPWNPTDPIENMFAQINDVYKYSVFSRQPIPQALVQAAEVLILQSGVFPTEYKVWQHEPKGNQIWVNKKIGKRLTTSEKK